MATTPPRKKKGGRRRIYLAIGVVALAVVGYLWYRSRSATTLAASPSGADASGPSAFPQPDAGGASASPSGGPPDTSLQDILSALAGENQDLLNSLLNSPYGIPSIQGASLGARAPLGTSVSGAGSVAQSPGGGSLSQPFGAVPAGQLQAIQAAAAYTGGAPKVLAPNLSADSSSINLPTTVSGSGPISLGLPTTVSGSGPLAPAPAQPVYGVTSGPPAGQRATTAPKRGVTTIH